jgi:hypothetical protein
MRAPRQAALAIASFLAVALLLASCGGGDSTETTSTAASTTARPTKTTGGSSARPAKREVAYRAPAPRPNAEVGGLSVTSGGAKQFKELGDYSTLRYGEEASRSELARAGRVMHGYLVAHMRYDWASSCSYLNERELEEVTTLASHFEQVAGKPCPPAISYLLGRVPAGKTRASSEMEAGAFRVSRDQGYLFYKVGGAPYMMPMSREGGEWKLFSLFTTRVSRPPTAPSSSG